MIVRSKFICVYDLLRTSYYAGENTNIETGPVFFPDIVCFHTLFLPYFVISSVQDVEASGLETAFAPLQPQPATRVEPCAFWFCLKIVIYCLMGATVITLSLVIKSLYSDGGRTFCGTLNIPYDRLVDMDAENRLYGAQQQDALTEILL